MARAANGSPQWPRNVGMGTAWGEDSGKAGMLGASKHWQKDTNQVSSHHCPLPPPEAPKSRGDGVRGWQRAGDSHSSSRQTGRAEGRMGGGPKQIIKTKSQ